MHCTLIHGYIKSPNMKFVVWVQSMPYDVKIGSHKIKIVIDDENLHKLPIQPNFTNYGWIDCPIQLAGKSYMALRIFFHTFSMVLYHKWDDKKTLSMCSNCSHLFMTV